MTNPLISVISPQQILDHEASQQTSAGGYDNPYPELQYESALAGVVRGAWQRNKLHKFRMNQILLACLRARRGYYSQSELAVLQEQGGLNIVWADLTETKCKAAAAWIREIFMTPGQQAWGVDPSPMPDLPIQIRNALIEKGAIQARETMKGLFQQTQAVLSKNQFRQMSMDIMAEMHDGLEKEYEKRARRAADRMEKKIADDMAEGGWTTAIDGFIDDFVTYPTAFLKGPLPQRKYKLKWLSGFTPGVEEKPCLQWHRVSPFDAYPAPHAIDCQTGEFIERVRYRRNELFDCIGLEGYNEDQIRAALRAYTNGHLEGWIWTDAERKRLEQETLFSFLSPYGVIDGIHYWGSVPGWTLMTFGVKGLKDIDPVQEYEVDCILIGPYIIRVAVNSDPLHRRPYWCASFDAIPGAIWGRSIPQLCETSQKMCNGLARAMADNWSISSGPQVWVHADRLADGEDTTNIYPWKVWHLKSDPTQGTNPGVGFFMPPSTSTELQNAYEKWELRADDATGVPRYTYGNEQGGGSTDTARGLAMMMNNAAKGLRRAIAAIDLKVIEPSITMSYVWNMLYWNNPDAKGDCNIVPRGAAAILIKESAAQHRMQALQVVSGNPLLAQLAGNKAILDLLRKALESIDVETDNFPTDRDLDKQEAAKQQAMQQQQEMAAQQAQAQQQAEEQNQQSKERMEGAKIAGNLEAVRIKHGIPTIAPPQAPAAQAPAQQPQPQQMPQ